jgi:hypothetical protein
MRAIAADLAHPLRAPAPRTLNVHRSHPLGYADRHVGMRPRAGNLALADLCALLAVDCEFKPTAAGTILTQRGSGWEIER